MPIVSTKGLKIWMEKATASALMLEPTAITKAKPAVVTVASSTGVAPGDPIAVSGTGFAELDGQSFVAGAVTATTIELVGSDTTLSTGTLGADPELSIIPVGDMCELCLAGIDLGDNAPTAISVATFCNPTASVPGNPAAATVGFTGYVDAEDPCYSELLQAVEDGLPRTIKVDLPGGNGYFLMEVIIGSVGYTIPIEGAVGFTFTGTQSTSLRHIF